MELTPTIEREGTDQDGGGPDPLWHIVHPSDDERALCGHRFKTPGSEPNWCVSPPGDVCIVCEDLGPRFYP